MTLTYSVGWVRGCGERVRTNKKKENKKEAAGCSSTFPALDSHSRSLEWLVDPPEILFGPSLRDTLRVPSVRGTAPHTTPVHTTFFSLTLNRKDRRVTRRVSANRRNVDHVLTLRLKHQKESSFYRTWGPSGPFRYCVPPRTSGDRGERPNVGPWEGEREVLSGPAPFLFTTRDSTPERRADGGD